MIIPGPAAARELFGIPVTTHGLAPEVAAIFDSSALTVSVMTDLGAGPVTFSGMVASDLNSFTVGGMTITRQ